MSLPSHVYLSPGLFGFSRVGSYDYFCHIERGLQQRFTQAGRQVRLHIVDVHPTSSIRRRAARLCEVVDQTVTPGSPIHFLGHSTGGLDARLVASPSMNLTGVQNRAWYPYLRSVTCMNTPHYGTPLASFFATVSGQRMLAAVSALTIVALKFGSPPLALTSSLVAAFGQIDRAFGIELRLLDSLTERVVRLLEDATSSDLRTYMGLLRSDQGAIIQLSPEAMDLFQAGVENNPHIVYQSAISYAPTPALMHWAKIFRSPWNNLSAPIFSTLYRLTSLEHSTYPCAPPGDGVESTLQSLFGHIPPSFANDGVVPVRSQLWGNVVWAGLGDHLDMVGHFGERRPSVERHTDWLCSQADFDRTRFDSLLDAITTGILASENQ